MPPLTVAGSLATCVSWEPRKRAGEMASHSIAGSELHRGSPGNLLGDPVAVGGTLPAGDPRDEAEDLPDSDAVAHDGRVGRVVRADDDHPVRNVERRAL